MTGGRFVPYRVAETCERAQPAQPVQNGEPAAGTGPEVWTDPERWTDPEGWEHAETWDYDEARANPEAYDQLELRLMREPVRGPRFARFQAAVADSPEVMTEAEQPAADPAAVSWLDGVKTGRFWTNALWLTGAACAGVMAGLVSTNFVALALNPEASTVLAGQLGVTLGPSRPALSTPAPTSIAALAATAIPTVRGPAGAVLSTPAGGLTPTRPATAPAESAGLPPAPQPTRNPEPAPAPVQVAALVEPDPVLLERTPAAAAATRPAPAPIEIAPQAAPEPAREPASEAARAPVPEAAASVSEAVPAPGPEAVRKPAPPTPEDTAVTEMPPMAAALQLAALVEPAPGLPERVRAAPVESPAAALPPAPPAPTADQAGRERAPTPPPPAALARAAPAPAVAAAAAAGGEYRVQLALLRDQQNAKYVWQDFVSHFGPPANNLHRYLFPTQTAHGVRHLLQVGPFGDEGHAEAMCNMLKQRGGDCVVVRQPS